MDFLDRHFLDNPIRAWLIAGALVCALWSILLSLKSRSAALLQRTEQRSAGLDLLLRLVNGTMQLFAGAATLYLAERLLSLPRTIERGSTVIVLVVTWIQVGRWALIVFDYFVERQRRRRAASDAAFAGSIAVIRFIALVAIWSLVVLLALDNLGVDVTALIAGLGIGGVAVALAVQSLLKDLLGSLSITLDRPFVLGDSITIGPVSGKVEHMGVKSTQLRGVGGEQVIVSNAEVVCARIRNFGRIEERRGVMIFSIAYETPTALVRRVSPIVRQVIEAQPAVRFERCHFREFGASGLTFEAVFFVLDSQVDALLYAQQSINLALEEALRREGIAFAYPVQRIEAQRATALSQPS